MAEQELKTDLISRIHRICNLLDFQTFQSMYDVKHDIESVAGILSDLMCVSNERNQTDIQFLENSLNFLEHASGIVDRICINETIGRNTGVESSVSQGRVGRPSFIIPYEQLEFLVSNGFNISHIANLFHLSKRTICRRLSEYGISLIERYSRLTDEELDEIVSDILNNYPNIGYRSVRGHLQRRGHKVQYYRIQESTRRVDLEGVLYRRLHLNPIRRRRYSVRAPNSLWHIDGYHKLISWRLVIHGGIDGYSRVPTYVKVSNNNRSDTVFEAFLEAVSNYGIPQRVRSDKGGENIKVAEYMISIRGTGKGSYITGRSVHNQRIERFWRDVWTGCVGFFYTLFCYMEEKNILQPSNEVHLEALHYVFIPRIQNHLDEFREAFIRRPLRTANQKTPLQMWIEGQIIDPFESLTESGVLLYGISQEGLMTSSDELQVEVCVTQASLSEENRQELSRQIDPLSYSHNHGIDLFLSTVNCILEKLVF